MLCRTYLYIISLPATLEEDVIISLLQKGYLIFKLVISDAPGLSPSCMPRACGISVLPRRIMLKSLNRNNDYEARKGGSLGRSFPESWGGSTCQSRRKESCSQWKQWGQHNREGGYLQGPWGCPLGSQLSGDEPACAAPNVHFLSSLLMSNYDAR